MLLVGDPLPETAPMLFPLGYRYMTLDALLRLKTMHCNSSRNPNVFGFGRVKSRCIRDSMTLSRSVAVIDWLSDVNARR